MKDMTKAIIGGLSLVGLAIAGYRTYELKKLRKELNEENTIDIEPEKVEKTNKN